MASINDLEREKFSTVGGVVGENTIIVHGDNWSSPVDTSTSLPSSWNTTGDIRQALDTGIAYRWNGSSWISWAGGSSGAVTNISVVSANGLAGTVANPTTTPAITLSTTVTGLLKGDGTSISSSDFTDTLNTSTPNATIPVAAFTATNAATNVDVAFIPKGLGAILAQIPDNTNDNGNKRGYLSVDLQRAPSGYGKQATQVASGFASTIPWGAKNTASGDYSFASGNSNIASGPQSVSMGYSNTSSGDTSTTFGIWNIAAGQYSTALCSSNGASGTCGMAAFMAGTSNEAQSLSETALGQYCTNDAGSATTWVTTDTLFKIGNGTGSGARSNAVKVLKNGNTTISGTLAASNLSGTNTGDQTKIANIIGGNSTTLLGAIPYQSNTDTTSLLSPNTASTISVLTQTGTGTNGAAPVWTASTGTGNVVFSASPTFTGNPVLGTPYTTTLAFNGSSSSWRYSFSFTSSIFTRHLAGNVLQVRTSNGATDGFEVGNDTVSVFAISTANWDVWANRSLSLGAASSVTGYTVLNNASNANTVTIQSGVTSTSYTLTLPTAVASAGQVLTDAAGNGTLSWTTVSGFAWGATASGTSGTGLALTVSNSASSSTIGQSITVGNTQTYAVTGLKIDTGTSAIAHTGLLVNAYNASTSAIWISIDTSSTGTGTWLLINNTNNSWNFVWTKYTFGATGTWTGITFTSTIGSYNVTMLLFKPNNSQGLVISQTWVFGFNSFVSTISPNANNSGFWKHIDCTTSENFAATTGRIYDAANISYSRTNTSTSGTLADSFNILNISDTAVQNWAGGTFTSAGAVLNLTSTATQTAGTLTHTKNVISLTQSATITTGKLLTGVVGSTERFKVHPMVANSGTNTAYLLDTTTSLSGTTKLLSIANAGTEKFAVDNAGAFSCGNTVAAAIAIASTHKVTVVIGGVTYYILASNV